VLPATVTCSGAKDQARWLHFPCLDRRSRRHVHVYRDGTLVVKWDLDNGQPMQGQASARIRRLIDELVDEGRL
jgi:hypothetical protein